ncbi:MAG: polysulfide reductase NrfD [Chloroflexi bacterium]|nr:polysulfide reductase NrfD [Chloroflexota bacterium]
MRAAEKVLWVLAIAGFLLGIVGLVQRVSSGHVEAAYGSYVPWGLWVAMYAMLIGMSAGSFIFAAATYAFDLRDLVPAARVALPVALGTFVGGILAIWLDLGHPLRAWKLLLNTGLGSVMGWMAWFYLAYFVVLCLLLWLTVVRGQGGTGGVRVLGWIGIVLALLFGGGEGALFGVVGARPFWQSGMTPVLFILEGLLSGVALVTFVALLLGTVGDRIALRLGRLVLGLLALSILFEWADLSIGYYASIPAYADGLRLVLFGQFAWVFWGVHVGLGAALPLGLLLWAGRSRGAVALAAALVAFTALATKLNVVIPGLAVPEFEGLQDAYTGPGLSFQYFPTTMEWLVSLWIAAVAGLVFLAAYRVAAKPARLHTVPQSTVRPQRAQGLR